MVISLAALHTVCKFDACLGTNTVLIVLSLLQHIEDIFRDINELVIDKMTKSEHRDASNIPNLTCVLDKFKVLFGCMDLVFTKLRILNPTEQEIDETKNVISKLEELWHELDLNITPKFHILVKHTIEQVIRFGGIADKVEDFVEKSHQTRKQLNHLVARMNNQCYDKQELVKIRRQWMKTNPDVSLQIINVNASRKGKLRNLPLTPGKDRKIRIKTEQRAATLQCLMNTESRNKK